MSPPKVVKRPLEQGFGTVFFVLLTRNVLQLSALDFKKIRLNCLLIIAIEILSAEMTFVCSKAQNRNIIGATVKILRKIFLT